jgi:hypothetical protein
MTPHSVPALMLVHDQLHSLLKLNPAPFDSVILFFTTTALPEADFSP